MPTNMKPREVATHLNQILRALTRSLPQYSQYARLYVTEPQHEKAEVIKQIAEDQEQMSERIAEFVRDLNQVDERGGFPMDFTDTHDLAIEGLWERVLQDQQYVIREVEQATEQLRPASAAFTLAEEALGLCRGHLDLLKNRSGSLQSA